MMKVNDATLKLIKEFEGFRSTWYRDPVGVWTIGYGHTDSAGSPKYATSKNMKLTEAEASAILQRDLERYEADVARLVRVPLNENQHGALVSFTYNLGAGNLGSSTLLRKLNAGDYAGAAAEFPRWNKAGGKELAGLTRRRAAEQALFLRPAKATSARPPAKPTPAITGQTKGLVYIIAALAAAVAAYLGVK